ncbi:MAG: hypothetical protein HUU46_14995 [Candidatus Hydrogenedentes bacterium]|nr:hypothetical protein [Candidatus Hydrogenedentota bacterium]
MNNSERYERLNDYVDGVLSVEEAREVELELERDPAFRAEERALRALLDEAKHLPKAAVPRCDLWQGIESRLCERVCGREESARTALRTVYRASLAAAAAAVIFAAGMWYGREGQVANAPGLETNVARTGDADGRVTPGGGDTPEEQDGTAPNPVGVAQGNDAEGPAPQAELAGYKQIELEYAIVREALIEKLDAARPNLAPETLQVVDDSLATIDRAIKEIEMALANDPGNHSLIRSLVAMHDQEVELLHQLARISELPREENA